MLVGILSDTHDKLARTQVAVGILLSAGAECLFHCGDFTGTPILSACTALPLYFVFGNNDADAVPELRRVAIETGATCLGWGGIVELEGKKIGMTHGHMGVDLRQILSESPDYLFSGHSHLQMDQMSGSVRRINPGALFRANQFSVALLNLSTGELQFLQVPA